MDRTTMVSHNIAGAVRLTGANPRISGSFAVYLFQATDNLDKNELVLLNLP